MIARIIIIVLAVTLLIATASAEMVFFMNGTVTEGKLLESTTDQSKLIVKSKYGQQEYDRALIVCSVSDAEAMIAKKHLAAGRNYLKRGMNREANEEFALVLQINKDFQKLIDSYHSDRSQRATDLERAMGAKKQEEAAPEPVVETVEDTEPVAQEPEEVEEPKPESSFLSKYKYYIGGAVLIFILIMASKRSKKD